MNIATRVHALQQRIKVHGGSLDSHGFFDLLTSDQLLEKVEALQPDYRERHYPPTETLSMFLCQAMSADRSCQQIVNATAVQQLVGGLTPHSTYTGSYCKARKRLPVDMVSALTRCVGDLVVNQLPTQWLWRGRKIKLVDGTTVTMPDTAANQMAYPQQSGQAPGLGYPICRMLAIICLASGSILNAAIGTYHGKGSDEQTLLRGMLETLESGDILIGDAYFANYFLLAELLVRGVDAVFEQQGARRKSTDFRKGKRLGSKDHLIVYTKPKKRPDWMSEAAYQSAPEEIIVRELKVGKKILVTTITSAKEVSKSGLKVLYKERWHIELDLRNIKTTMGLEVFSCKTPDMVEKEMWVYLLAYNLIRLVIAQSAALTDILPRQISFKHTVQIWLSYRFLQSALCDDTLLVLCTMIAENVVGGRPGRVEPRAVKRRPKPYKLLMVPREQAREAIRKHGHPKKQK